MSAARSWKVFRAFRDFFERVTKGAGARSGTIDAAKYHEGKGATTELDGAYHIGLFLRFCAVRGLAAEQHARQAHALSRDPASYLVKECAARLLSSDLTPAGAAFADRFYSSYLSEFADMALGGSDDVYRLRNDADREGIEQLMFEYLDRGLAQGSAVATKQ